MTFLELKNTIPFRRRHVHIRDLRQSDQDLSTVEDVRVPLRHGFVSVLLPAYFAKGRNVSVGLFPQFAPAPTEIFLRSEP